MKKNTHKCLSRTSYQVTTFMLSQASEPNYERSLNSPTLRLKKMISVKYAGICRKKKFILPLWEL